MLLLETLALPEPADPESILDEGLLLQTAEGDQEAFRKLYEDTDRTIYGFILSILKNPQDAEEVMQETYMKVWTSARRRPSWCSVLRESATSTWSF